MELGLGFVANKTPEFSVDQMAREVRTGQTKVRPVKAELLEALERAEDEDERQSAKDAIAADEKAAYWAKINGVAPPKPTAVVEEEVVVAAPEVEAPAEDAPAAEETTEG